MTRRAGSRRALRSKLFDETCVECVLRTVRWCSPRGVALLDDTDVTSLPPSVVSSLIWEACDVRRLCRLELLRRVFPPFSFSCSARGDSLAGERGDGDFEERPADSTKAESSVSDGKCFKDTEVRRLTGLWIE